MKLEVDRDKCCGFGECVAVAPDIFALGGDDRVTLVEGRTVGAGDEDRVRDAAFACPAEAIEVIE